MKLIRRILGLLLAVVVIVILFQNQKSLGQDLQFSFLKWDYSLVLGFWILFAFVTGAATFALIDAWKSFFLRMAIRKRDQEIARLEHELALAHKARSVSGDSIPE